jgi:hypothetical protein
MTDFCMWLMFVHGLTVGLGVMGVMTCGSSKLRWLYVLWIAMAVFNAATLKADAQVPNDRRWPWPDRPVPAVVEV